MTDPHNEPVPLRADDNRFSGLIRSTRRVATLFAACEASAKRCQQHQAPDEIGLTAEYEDDIDELTAAVGELRVVLSNVECLDDGSVLAIQIKRLKKSVEHLDGGYDPLAFEAIASVADRLEATKQVVATGSTTGGAEAGYDSGRDFADCAAVSSGVTGPAGIFEPGEAAAVEAVRDELRLTAASFHSPDEHDAVTALRKAGRPKGTPKYDPELDRKIVAAWKKGQGIYKNKDELDSLFRLPNGKKLPHGYSRKAVDRQRHPPKK
jgi:hypothetical protein